VSRTRLLLLSRPDCHLCERFREELEAAFQGRFELQERCVDERPEWRERFGRCIPVLLSEAGEVLCETEFNPERLRPLAA
jgi:hypothetical protein